MFNNDILQSDSSSILIVDDNPQNLQVLGKILKENNYKIEFAINGETALKWLNTRKFDLVLLDINMPGMNGFEVCGEIRSNPDMSNIPVIFLSAECERESILKGFELGAQDYITKPFDSRELLVRVKTHLSLKHSQGKLEKLNKSLEEKVIERTLQLKEANEKLELLNIKLLDLDKSKSDFLHIISHEIRTPLNGILGPLELLKGPVYAKEIGDLVEILDLSVKRLERFSLDALLITRLKTKPFEIIKDKIHLSMLINNVLQENKDIFESENFNIRRSDKTIPDIIFGETGLIKKCLINILNNAVRFSPKNDIIEINTYAENQLFVCEVSNKGNGFPTEIIDHVFELFSVGDVLRDSCTGIGLPIAKMIMEAHGGNITVNNIPGGGASVRLHFHSIIKG